MKTHKIILTISKKNNSNDYNDLILLFYKNNINIEIITINNKNLQIKVDFLNKRKLFAICKNLCYNISIEKHCGFEGFFINIFNMFPLLISSLFFIIICFTYNNIILKIECMGSGQILKNEIVNTLEKNNIKKYAFFKNINYKSLSNKLLTSNTMLNYVSCYKRGNKLVIYSTISNTYPNSLSTDIKDLKSDCDGIVKKIIVIKGTPICKEGEEIKTGDVLVGAFYEFRDNRYSTNVLAQIHVECEKVFTYSIDNPSEPLIKAYILLTKEQFKDDCVANYIIDNQKIIITIKYIHIINGG